jgi:hypothetical protein
MKNNFAKEVMNCSKEYFHLLINLMFFLRLYITKLFLAGVGDLKISITSNSFFAETISAKNLAKAKRQIVTSCALDFCIF